MELSNSRRDSKAAYEGMWVEDIPGMGDLRLHVVGMSAPSVRNYQMKLTRAVPNKERNPDRTLKLEASRNVLAKTLSNKVLIDWDNLTTDGKKIEFTKEYAFELLSDPDFEPFQEAVIWAANYADGIYDQETEDVQGN